jgi:hypothetical protein
MSEIALQNAPPTAERQRLDVDIVCFGFGPVFDLRSQIATSKFQTSYQGGFVFFNPVITA